MLNRLASLAMSTSVLKALPGKLDIKRHSPSILYVPAFCEIFTVLCHSKLFVFFGFFCILNVEMCSLVNQKFFLMLYRGSYMSAHVLLNLLNELGKRDKMRGLSSILSLFRNELNKFNNIRARMLDSIYHMILSIL